MGLGVVQVPDCEDRHHLAWCFPSVIVRLIVVYHDLLLLLRLYVDLVHFKVLIVLSSASLGFLYDLGVGFFIVPVLRVVVIGELHVHVR